MSKLPKNSHSRVIGAEARKIVHYVFPSQDWEYREETGNDVGIDCKLELIENDKWISKKIEGQIKGTANIEKYRINGSFSYPLDVKTITYGLSSSSAFVLFLVDTENEIVYYLPIQDYFISDPSLFDKLENNTSTLNLHIPFDNSVSENNFELIQIAKSVYINEPSRDLEKK